MSFRALTEFDQLTMLVDIPDADGRVCAAARKVKVVGTPGNVRNG